MFDPTRPEEIEFTPVSPALIRVRVISLLITMVIVMAITGVLAFFVSYYFAYATAVFALLLAWLLWLIPRQVRAIGYYEGDNEFLIRKGIMFKSLNVIPYGRIQFVDVNEGPIARYFGITTITLHTASADTAGMLDGLPAAEAARLRDLLATRGSSEQAGL